EPSPENGQALIKSSLTEETLGPIWEQVLAQVGPMLAGDLRIVQSLAISGPNTLVIQLPPGYNHIEDHHLDSARLGRIETALQQVSGQVWNLRLESAPSG